MKNRMLRSLFAIVSLFAISATPLLAVDATYSNLTVTGTADFGTWSSGDSGPGLILNYVDGATATINFIGSGSATAWQWWNYNGSANSLSMGLDQNNRLLLYSGTVANIALNPSGTSSIAGSLTIGGTNNTLPNQTLLSGSSILTETLADGRYLTLSAAAGYLTQTAGDARYPQSTNFNVGSVTYSSSSAPTLSLVGGTATSPYSVAIMTSSTASGTFAVAMGYRASAGGLLSGAVGFQATASGDLSTATGERSVASGANSIATGAKATASGNNSTATGYTSTASGNLSAAYGNYSQATGDGAIAIGNHAYADGLDSIAVGGGSFADGEQSSAYGFDAQAVGGCSIAIGFAPTSAGYISVAIGNYSTATGNYSTASGFTSGANGDYSTASGCWSAADGDMSTAAGYTTTAAGYGQFVIGQWNLSQGDPDNWVVTDDLLEIGNGVDGDHPGNALVVKKNGDTAISGALVVSATTGSTNQINGLTKVNGGLVVTGTAVPVVLASGTVTTVVSTGSNSLVLVPQQGDISMGVFVAGAQPQ